MAKIKAVLGNLPLPLMWFFRTRKRNKFLVLVGIVILLIVGGKYIQSRNMTNGYTFANVEKATITEYVSETGNVHTVGRADVYSPTTGTIDAVYVNNNELVTVNTSLFRVRANATDEEKASAYANYQSALADIRAAENDMKSKQSALDKVLDDIHLFQYGNGGFSNIGSANETQAQKTLREQAEAASRSSLEALTSAKAALEVRRAAYQATQNVTVRANTSGSITNFSSSVGDTVTANVASTQASTPVLTIANLGDYSILVALNEVDVPKVKPGQQVVVTLDAFPLKKFNGTVRHVDEVGTNNAGVITYTVFVTITDADAAIKPGMTANVEIAVDSVENVLSVPNSAIKPYKNGKAVRALGEKKTKENPQGIKYIPVEIGVRGEEKTQIISGVSEGQQIISALPNDQINRKSLF